MQELKYQKVKKKNSEKGVSVEYGTLFCPSSIDQIPLKDAVEFQMSIHENVPESVRTLSKLKGEEYQNELGKWTPMDWQMYYYFIGQVLSTIMKQKDSKGQYIPANINDILGVKKGVPIEDQTSGDNLCAVYSHLVKMITGYKPKIREEFEYKGRKFMVPEYLVDNYGREKYAPDITTAEAIELLQLESVFSRKNDDGEFIIKNRKYHTDLGAMACLCREVKKDGTVEQIPLNTHQRHKFIEKRMSFFNDVPMSLGLDIGFFLTSSKKTSMQVLSRAVRLKNLLLIYDIKRNLKK